MSNHKQDDCRCTTDAPCPGRNEPLTMVGPDYRQMAHPEHMEFAPTHQREERNPQGWSRVDGLKKLDGMELYVVAKLYRRYLGTVDGEDRYMVGEYVGNRRVIMDNGDTPLEVGTTWQIYLQEDKDLDTPIECYRLCDLQVVERSGTRIVTANDYKPKKPGVMMYYEKVAPEKPALGLEVVHPIHGGGEVVRVTGSSENWYAGVQYSWGSVHVPPSEGVSVRREVDGHNGRTYFVYGDVVDVAGDIITVEYENGGEHKTSHRDFYKTYAKMVDAGWRNFHELFGLDRPGARLEMKSRVLTRDTRTTNEKVFSAPSRSTMAFSALVAANTPDSGHFVPKSSRGSYMDSGFRWHRERPLPPKDEAFAPLVGRPKKVPKPKRGWSFDRLNATRKQLALAPGQPSGPHSPARLTGSIWGQVDENPPKPEEVEPLTAEEWAEYHGKTVLF